MDSVAMAQTGPRYGHFIGSFEPIAQEVGDGRGGTAHMYRAEIGGVMFELYPGRSEAGEHVLAVTVCTPSKQRPDRVTLELAR